MNRSINQVLSRTIITSGTTLIVVSTLYIFGGDVINTFAFVLLVGILVGTYSSVFVASPVALFVARLIAARRERKRKR
jgi:preprotein translocase subunit SecF